MSSRTGQPVFAATICTLVLAGAPAAHGATVSATTGGSGPYGVAAGSVRFDAQPGEHNVMSAQLVPGSRGLVEVRDDGAVLTAGPRCTLVSASVARCDAAADFVDVTANLGDGDDSATVAEPLYGILDGGAGDDTLTGGCQVAGGDGNDTLIGCANALAALGHRLAGGPGADSIQGGDAAEVIDGGGGADVIAAGGGADTIADGDADTTGRDVIDGQSGSDTINYADRATGVHVDLSQPDSGARGENDSLRGIENVIAGAGSDVLIGDDGPNRLDGGAGNDSIDGRGGDDQLFDGGGSDRTSGGGGHDYIVTRDVYRDSVRCGAGTDQLLSDRGDVIAPGCEQVSDSFRIVAANRVGARERRVLLGLQCYALDELPRAVSRQFESCSFDVALRIRVHGRLTTAGTTRCGPAGCRALTMSGTSWRILLARRSTAAVLEFTRVPRAGTLRHTDPVTLKVRR